MNRRMAFVVAAGLLGAIGAALVGCERAIQGGEDPKTDYADNSRFFGSYTGVMSGGIDSTTIEGDGDSIDGAQAAVQIGSDSSLRDAIWTGYVYIPASGNAETIYGTNAVGEVYTEQISIYGSTLSFHITDSNGTRNVVFDFNNVYTNFDYRENATLDGTPYAWTGYFVRISP